MLSKSKEEMAQLKEEKGESVIPKGDYCYCRTRRVKLGEDGLPVFKINLCPYLDADYEKGGQSFGYCWFLECGDWEEDGTFLLFDQCKECGMNDDWEEGL